MNRIAIILAACLIPAVAHATTFYCDPVSGSLDNDGLAATVGGGHGPWPSLQDTWRYGKFNRDNPAYVQDGDTVLLLDGHHGWFSTYDYGKTVSQRWRDDWVTIQAADGASPSLWMVNLNDSRYFKFVGVTISPDTAVPSRVGSGGYCVRFHDGNGPMWFEDCDIYTVLDVSAWTTAEWLVSWSAIYCPYGDNDGCKVVNCTIKNVFVGVMVGTGSYVAGNLIDGFCTDGIQFVGANTVIEDNTVQNCYNDGSDIHADLIQCNEGSGPATNVAICRNILRGYYLPTRQTSGLMRGCQGMLMEPTDLSGMVIENNLVLPNHATHGITLGDDDGESSGSGVIIRNNTIYHCYGDGVSQSDTAQITLNRGSTTDIWIVNNTGDNFPTANPAVNLVVAGNVDVTAINPAAMWTDWEDHDYTLLSDSPLVDVGSATQAAATDIAGLARPLGDGYDVGCYEYDAPPASVLPDAPTNLSPTAGAGKAITTTLSWTAGTGSTSSDVYFGAGANPVFVQNQAGTTYDPGTLSLGTTYSYRIGARNSEGVTFSKIVVFTTIYGKSKPVLLRVLP
jgi:hypothetical protein